MGVGVPAWNSVPGDLSSALSVVEPNGGSAVFSPEIGYPFTSMIFVTERGDKLGLSMFFLVGEPLIIDLGEVFPDGALDFLPSLTILKAAYYWVIIRFFSN